VREREREKRRERERASKNRERGSERQAYTTDDYHEMRG
jgi:hypothetical protein